MVSLQDPDLIRRRNILWAVPGLIMGKVILVATLALTVGDGSGGRNSFVIWE